MHKAEIYRLEESCSNLKGKQIAPLKKAGGSQAGSSTHCRLVVLGVSASLRRGLVQDEEGFLFVSNLPNKIRK